MQPLEKQPHSFYLILLRFAVGAVFLVQGISKWSWLQQPDVLTKRFNLWLDSVGSVERAYIELMMPTAEVPRYLVLFGELATAVSLILGVLVPLSSVLAAFMVFNFKLASGGLLTWRFLGDPYGIVLLVLLIMFATTRAGRSFGLDSVLQRKLPSVLA
ncbi:MAG: DoxX family membrane protein [Bacteroidota bacterium]